MTRLIFALLLLPTQLFAADTTDNSLLKLLRFDEMAAVIQTEGLAQNDSLPSDVFGIASDARWAASVAGMFDKSQIVSDLEQGFLSSLGDTPRDTIVAFLESDAWQVSLDYEIAARLAMLDPAVEDAAIAAYWDHLENNSQRLKDVTDLIETNDLIDANVVSSMNAAYQFNLGLKSGGLDLGMSEDDVLAQIWSQEDTFRQDISEWLFAFMIFAYDPMDPALVPQQTAFYATDAGQALNQALNDSFDRVYMRNAHDLGAALAGFAQQKSL